MSDKDPTETIIKVDNGTTFIIGDDIVITVLGIREGKYVRFGVNSPRDIPVHPLQVPY